MEMCRKTRNVSSRIYHLESWSACLSDMTKNGHIYHDAADAARVPTRVKVGWEKDSYNYFFPCLFMKRILHSLC